MRLAMAQMSMSESIESNLNRSLSMMEQAGSAGADLIFFPELQLTPFFPQYGGQDAQQWLLCPDSPPVRALSEQCRRMGLWACPNLYLCLDGKRYDASILFDSKGELRGISKMVHICQAPGFFEQDYYAPSEDGFPVYDTPFGKIGVVICFDRHIPTSLHSCALRGAELALIPTANRTDEPLDLYEWEVRVQAFQNTMFLAMCNRVGSEGEAVFAGNSLVAGPEGNLHWQAGGTEQLCLVEIPLEQVRQTRLRRPWLSLSGEKPGPDNGGR